MPHKDPIVRKKYFQEYRKKNRININKSQKKWSDSEKGKKYQKEYRLKNIEKLTKYDAERRKKPGFRERYNFNQRNWMNKRLREDPHFRIKQNLSHRIYMALKDIAKSKRTVDLLGCTIEEFWIHLEKSFKPGMTKENYGKWHVDHIRPCASFDLTKPEEQAKCFHYINLQALWARENIIKSDKM